jgi:predicted NAD/FAD-binding protein
VIACHSDQALAMLGDASTIEQELLGAIPYQNNDVVLHTDDSVLPSKRLAWSSWNYWLREEQQDQAVLTYNMNILQGIEAPCTFCVTLNATDKIDPDKILGRYKYSHPVFSMASVDAAARWSEINGVNQTWFCGAYWGNGFHEDGVASGLRVARALGVKWGD